MKRNLVITAICLLFSVLAFANPQLKAAYNLIERIAPGYQKQFKLELIESDKGSDVFEVSSHKGKVLLRGNNTIALATAFNWYLKYTCNAHLSWFGDQLNLPQTLPLPKEAQRQLINGKHRVYMNYCTLSYSAPWWDWTRWQRELDYMAMNSINMPLSMVGLEGVWYNTLLKFNFTDEEARTFLTGPGHSAWQWMQNLEGDATGGGKPLPKSWIDSHVRLGQQIMKRQLELGMQPIQQGFSGYVPRKLKEKYPQAQIRLQGKWCGLTGAAQLDPTDSLFLAFGKVFMEEEKKLFGAYGVYASDPFHESAPPVNTPEYLNEVGKNIHQLFKSFDKNAVWAIQSWSIRENVVSVVPKSDLLILDLNGGKYTKLWGFPVVVGNLHNFGGRINLHGDLAEVASNQYITAKEKAPNVCGSGLFMEGITQNQVFYDLAFEMPMHPAGIDVKEWLRDYSTRRYGASSDASYKAWLLLLEGPYRPGTSGTERSSIMAARPALNVKKSGPNAELSIPYSPLLLLKAEGLLLKDAAKLKASAPYRFDIIDVQRQLMTNLGQLMHKSAAKAFAAKDKEQFKLHSERFKQLLRDADELLRTRSEFNFDQWISDARSWGTTEEEKNLLQKDATTLVTIWGKDANDPVIFDYSWKEWSGLIDRFYLQRWTRFYDMLADCLQTGKEYSEEGLPRSHDREAFRANDFYTQLGDWELEFAAQPHPVRMPITQGDEVEVATRLYKKYSALAAEYYVGEIKADKMKEGGNFENLGE